MAIAAATIEAPGHDPYMRPWAMRYARERVGLSLEEAAARITDRLTWPGTDPEERTVTPELIAAWEAGQVVPSSLQQTGLWRIYLYPYTGYCIDEPLEEPITDYRAAPDGTAVATEYGTYVVLDQFARFYDMAEETAAGFGGEMEAINVPYAGSKTVDQLASEIRATLGVNEFAQRSWRDVDAAYDEWKRRIESSGVFVFTLPLDVEQVRGASRWDRLGPATILVSTHESPAARTVTLLHEYAHLTQRREPSAMCDPNWDQTGDRIEQRMNRIAAEVLLPRDWLRRETNAEGRDVPFVEWPASARKSLTETFAVGSRFMASRLAELGLAEKGDYAQSPEQVVGQQNRESMTDGERYIGYLGEPMVQILRTGAKRGGVTVGETAKLWIRLDYPDLHQILYDDRP